MGQGTGTSQGSLVTVHPPSWTNEFSSLFMGPGTLTRPCPDSSAPIDPFLTMAHSLHEVNLRLLPGRL